MEFLLNYHLQKCSRVFGTGEKIITSPLHTQEGNTDHDSWYLANSPVATPKIPSFYDNSNFPMNCKTFHINAWHYANQLPLLWATNVVCFAGKDWKDSQGNGKHYWNYITNDLGLKIVSSVLLWSVISDYASSQSCIKDATGRRSRLQWILQGKWIGNRVVTSSNLIGWLQNYQTGDTSSHDT